MKIINQLFEWIDLSGYSRIYTATEEMNKLATKIKLLSKEDKKQMRAEHREASTKLYYLHQASIIIDREHEWIDDDE